jgi:hypothetical protein
MLELPAWTNQCTEEFRRTEDCWYDLELRGYGIPSILAIYVAAS